MNGEDGRQEPEIHPGPDVTEFAKTYVAFITALTKALTEGEQVPLKAEHEIELFRIWYIDKTDREMLIATSPDNPPEEKGEWFSDQN